MQHGQRDGSREQQYRYTQYDAGAGTVAMIYDPDDDDAWIRSSAVVPVGEDRDEGTRTMTFDPSADAYRVPPNPADPEPLSSVVVRAVADVARVDPLEMEPLYDQIDADTLDRLGDTTPDDELHVTVHGHEVTVEADGAVVVRPSER